MNGVVADPFDGWSTEARSPLASWSASAVRPVVAEAPALPLFQPLPLAPAEPADASSARPDRFFAAGWRHNLPQALTSFVGREPQLAEVGRLLTSVRLLTLTGTGGVGKTRLAHEVAARLLDVFPGGVWIVDLAALSDPSLVPQTLATVLDVREEPGRSLASSLSSALRAERLLLVLDNCEHLLDACASITDALLRACPDLSILAAGGPTP